MARAVLPRGRVSGWEVGLQWVQLVSGWHPSASASRLPVSDSASLPPPTAPTFNDFACFYLYGFSNHPYQQSADLKKFGELFSLVIGEHGGVGIAGTFHPYQLLGPGDLSVWYAAYAQLYAQPNRFELFAEMTLEKAQFVLVPPASFAEYHRWPDTRLTTDENPIFGRFVPFVIPFLVRKDPELLRWDKELAAAAGNKARLAPYLKAVNEAIRFVQPAPAFVLGFGEFDEQQPEQLVEKFLAYLDVLL